MQHHATLERTCVQERKSRDQETKYAVQLEQSGCARSAYSGAKGLKLEFHLPSLIQLGAGPANCWRKHSIPIDWSVLLLPL